MNGSRAGPRGAGRSSSRASRGTSPGLRERRRASYPHPPRELRQAVVHIDIFLGAVHELIALPARGEGRNPPLSPRATSSSRLELVVGPARSPPSAPWPHGTRRGGRWAWAAVPHGRSRPRPTFCGRLGARGSPGEPERRRPGAEETRTSRTAGLDRGKEFRERGHGFSHLPWPGGRGLHPAEPTADPSGGCWVQRGWSAPQVLIYPKNRDIHLRGQGLALQGTHSCEPGHFAWPRSILETSFSRSTLHSHPLTPSPRARAFLNQACNFCPYTLRHTRKLISLRSTEAHTQLSHDPLQSYTVRSHSGC